MQTLLRASPAIMSCVFLSSAYPATVRSAARSGRSYVYRRTNSTARAMYAVIEAGTG